MTIKVTGYAKERTYKFVQAAAVVFNFEFFMHLYSTILVFMFYNRKYVLTVLI